MNRAFKILSLFFMLFDLSYANIITGPILQAVTANSVYVLVECTSLDTAFVQYGLSPSLGFAAKTESIEQTTNNTYVHNIKLNGLNGSSLYYYKVMHQSSQTVQYTFNTSVSPGTTFRFIWMADCRTDTVTHNQIASLIKDVPGSRFSLYGGDFCVSPAYADWIKEFFTENEKEVIVKLPFFNAPGNHEGWDTNAWAFTQSPLSPSGTQAYYSFDYGDMHVLVINNQVSYSPGSPQYIFAATDLASSNKKWKIVASHNPAYCSGGHGEDSVMIAMAQNIFVPNHVDLLISGHSHFYQHNFVSPIHYMVIGSAGAPLYNPTTASYTVKSVKDYCWGIFDVTPTSFYLRVFNNNNSLLDSLRLIKVNAIRYSEKNVSKFKLYPNYPNPFNPATKIKFDVPLLTGGKEKVILSVTDILGRNVDTLINDYLKPGSYEVEWNGSNFPSGVYFCKLEAGSFSKTRKITLVK